MAISDSNVITVQHSGTVSDGAGDDIYVIGASGFSAVTDNAQITISDGAGANKLLLEDGLNITSSTVFADALQLTLSNGAVIQLLAASNFTFFTGTAASPSAELSYAAMATSVLGVTIPTTGSATGTSAVVGTTTSTTETFALVAGATSVDEGSTATFTLTTTGVADGTAVAYTLTGIEAADLSSGSLTGTATVSSGTATISVALAADTTTEGAETLTVSINDQTATASTIVNDTSLAASTFTLTTASTDDLTGTTADDTIAGVLSGLSSTNTLQTTDKIDGGAGSDTLTLSMSSDFAGFGTGSIANVEILDITNTATLSRSFDSTGITGVTTIKLNANDVGFTLADLDAAGKTVEISNADAASTININHVATAVTGSTDALTLTLTDVGTAKTTSVAAKELSFVSADIESLTVNSAGTSNDANISLAGTTSVTITGAGSLTSSGFGTAVTNLDASAATGNLTLTETTTSSFATAKMGTGDDTLTVANAAVSATFDGGAGTDELVFSGSAAGTIQPTLTNFETLSATGLAGALVVSGVNTTGLTKVQAVNALGADLTLASLPNSSLTIELTDTLTGSGSETATSNKIVYTSAGSLTLETSTNKTSATAKATDIEASAVTSATINVGTKAELTGKVTLASATSVEVDSKVALTGLDIIAATATTVNITSLGNVTGSATLDLNKLQSMTLNVTGAVDLNNNTSTLIGVNAKSTTVDASKVTGTVALDIGSYSAGSGQAQITGSTLGANTIVIGTGRNEVAITGGINNDAVSLFTNGAVVASISGEGSYSISLGAVSTADSLTLGGTGSDTFDFSDATLTLSGVDHIVAETSEALTVKAAALSGQTISIGTTAAATPADVIGTVTLEGTTSADTIDASDLTFAVAQQVIINGAAGNDIITGSNIGATASTPQNLNGAAGNDTITGGSLDDKIEGGDGTDTISISTGGADIVILNGTSAITSTFSDVDTITGFTGGSTASVGDDLAFGSTFLGGTSFASGAVVISASDGNGVADDGIYIVSDGAALDEAGIVALVNGNGSVASNGTFSAATSEDVIIIANDASGNANIYYVNDSLDGDTVGVTATDVVLIGILSGTTAETLIGNNFAAAV